uniref:Methyltransferase type 11 domain-containing protein n=1 Tax=Podarcis muralis TaxID=64176 RepID=A0A670I9W9_PODMU
MEATCLVVLLRLCVQILAFPAYLLWYLGIWEPLCKKLFPYFMSVMAISYNKQMSDKKREMFSNLKDFASPTGALTLLEIGTGTGFNFQFYPVGCKIICTDPNPNFQKFLNKSLAENPHVQVPAASVDVVVSTLVLCSVKSPEQAMKEVLRVLRLVSSSRREKNKDNSKQSKMFIRLYAHHETQHNKTNQIKQVRQEGPIYLKLPLHSRRLARTLRSSSEGLLAVRSLSAVKGTRQRAFSVVASTLWNTLPRK